MNQVVLDIWEENARFDEEEALAAGVQGIIMRLNSMSGGHHMDKNFENQWEQSKAFLRMPYFVYNPWVKGKVNASWFLTHAPTDGYKRLALDVEVKYANYSPGEYSNQVIDCVRLLREAGWEPTIYTGYGFLNLLNLWPKNTDYWWARYPNACKPRLNTWAELMTIAQNVAWEPDLYGTKHVCPGTVKLWQIADSWFPKGTYTHAIDVNVFNGTPAELRAWFGYSAEDNPDEGTPTEFVTIPEAVKTLMEEHKALFAGKELFV